MRHFAFPVGFLLLAVPWPSGLEQDIVQGLMRGVAAIAAELMNVLAIPAEAQGNLIRVRDQLVGVDEACSGIRSLQTMLMGGCLLGELSRLSAPRRVALLAGGTARGDGGQRVPQQPARLAGRATRRAPPLEKYHDLAGISVLLIVFAGLLWLNARLLARGHRRRRSRRTPRPPAILTASPPPAAFRLPSAAFLLAVVGWLACVEIGTAAWYRLGRARYANNPACRAGRSCRPAARPISRTSASTTVPRACCALTVAFPPAGPGPTPRQPAGPPDGCTLFFFRWEPGHASAAQADMHQPHICLTASGLTMTADHGTAPLALPDGLTLPVRRYEFVWHGQPVYVFFVVWQDGVGQQTLADAPTERWDRLRAVASNAAPTWVARRWSSSSTARTGPPGRKGSSSAKWPPPCAGSEKRGRMPAAW